MKGRRVTLAFIILLLAGCGGTGNAGSSAKTADGARATVRAFIVDMQQGRGGDACDLLTAPARAQAGGVACGAKVLLARSLLGRKTLAEYEASLGRLPVTITGSTATMPGLGQGTSRLVYTGGRWLIGESVSG